MMEGLEHSHMTGIMLIGQIPLSCLRNWVPGSHLWRVSTLSQVLPTPLSASILRRSAGERPVSTTVSTEGRHRASSPPGLERHGKSHEKNHGVRRMSGAYTGRVRAFQNSVSLLCACDTECALKKGVKREDYTLGLW